MATINDSWTVGAVSGITASDQARLHVGPHVEYNVYADESRLSTEDRQRLREDAILSSLAFAEMKAREGAVDDPCHKTFDWIFDAEVTARRQCYQTTTKAKFLTQWLGHERGMFFIVRKAGSGKSTLMRHIAGHPQTQALLQGWAED